jgi:hypothetical protein
MFNRHPAGIGLDRVTEDDMADEGIVSGPLSALLGKLELDWRAFWILPAATHPYTIFVYCW